MHTMWWVTLSSVLALMFLVWLLSLRLRDSGIIDVFWGLAHVLVAALWWFNEAHPTLRQSAIFWLSVLWGLRLSGYLAWRNLGNEEDYRYAAMRKRYGSAWPLLSLPLVFLSQAVLVWIVSWPVQAVFDGSSSPQWSWLDTLGALVCAAGIVFESTADLQLARFKADPSNRDRVCSQGLWRYSRHPNYFGDSLVWWGLGLLALAAGAWWSLTGPILMTLLLLRVSGVTLLEATIHHRRPGYEAYRRSTSAFFPRPPRGNA